MGFEDFRGKRVAFVNHCLLNQNARAPGVAVRRAAFPELARILHDNGVGIEQLPCLESITLGGADRAVLERYRPVIAHALRHRWFPLLRLVFNLWLLVFYRWPCRRAAKRVAEQARCYLDQGYEVVGVIGVNDSPTCGVTRTLDVVEYVRRVVIADGASNPAPAAVQATLRPGRSFFIGQLQRYLERHRLPIKVVGFEPWAESPTDEAARIGRLLGLSVAGSEP